MSDHLVLSAEQREAIAYALRLLVETYADGAPTQRRARALRNILAASAGQAEPGDLDGDQFFVSAREAYLRGFEDGKAEQTAAVRDVLAERVRQVEVEGWTPEHDDEHYGGEMAIAASCYAESAAGFHYPGYIPETWPWASNWWKPGEPRSDLVKAGALILAEIERIDRAAKESNNHG